MRTRLFALLPLAGATLLGAVEPAVPLSPAATAAVLQPAERTAILKKTATLRLAPDR